MTIATINILKKRYKELNNQNMKISLKQVKNIIMLTLQNE